MRSYTRNATRYVSKLATKLRRELDKSTSGEQLTGAQARALRFIMTREPLELTQRDMEEEYSIRPSSCSEMLRQLESKGFLTRIEDPQNRRQKLLAPTEKAQKVKIPVREELDELEQTLTRGIPEEKLEICLDVLEQMLANMEGK